MGVQPAAARLRPSSHLQPPAPNKHPAPLILPRKAAGSPCGQDTPSPHRRSYRRQGSRGTAVQCGSLSVRLRRAGGRAGAGGGGKAGCPPLRPRCTEGAGERFCRPTPPPPLKRREEGGRRLPGKVSGGACGEGLGTAGARTAKSPWAVIIRKHCDH